MTRPPIVRTRRSLISRTGETSGMRALPEETPVVFTYGRKTHAVMLASPTDLEDFAVGFSFTERIVEGADEIEELEIVDLHNGIELRMMLAASRDRAIEKRRRRFAGPAGCGLCGIESLDAATVQPPAVRSALQSRFPRDFPSADYFAGPSVDQRRDSGGPCRWLLVVGGGAFSVCPRRRGPSQRPRQTGWCASSRRYLGKRGVCRSHKPRVDRTRAEGCHTRLSYVGGGFGPDRPGAADGGRRKSHPRGGRARRQFRSFHPPRTNPLRQPCRLTRS